VTTQPAPLPEPGTTHSPAPHDPAERPLDAETAALVAGLSLGAFWRSVAAGRMPSPVYPMPRAPRWYASEIRAAMEKTRSLPRNQAAARRLARQQAIERGDVQVTSPSPSRANALKPTKRDLALEMLRRPEGASPDQIADQLHCSEGAARAQIEELKRKGINVQVLERIRTRGQGAKGSYTVYYVAAEPAP
jgi:predicted DNA-binding transcriptional regulator AlpA